MSKKELRADGFFKGFFQNLTNDPTLTAIKYSSKIK